MTVTPLELKGVLSNEFDFPKFQIVGNVHRQDDTNAGHLILA
jgi:hypothetical protein